MARPRQRSTSAAQDALAVGSRKEVGPMKELISGAPRMRITRSQSRELESTEQRESGSSAGMPGDSSRRRWGQNKGRMSLGVVVEEPTVQSPRKSGHAFGNRSFWESQEDTVNISGTTILPSEPDTNLDPDMMIETLPDLQRTAQNVLDYLIPSSGDPVSIVHAAKRLADPKNTQSKRLQRAVPNLAREAAYFGHQKYIDVKLVNQLLAPALEKKDAQVGEGWKPDLVLHQANCARFALEVLLANAGTNSPKQAIKNLEDMFPLPFMSGIADSNEQKAAGESSLNKETFDLALEIRTQSLILDLERQQHEPEFDPNAIVTDHFFEMDVYDEDEFDSSIAPLRGFGLAKWEDSDGHLSEQYRDAICDRYNEIRVYLLDAEDGMAVVDELRSGYRWQKFVLRAAQWVRKRIQEIAADLQVQKSAEVVRSEFFAKPEPLERVTGTPRPSVTPVAKNRTPVIVAPRVEQRESVAPAAENRLTTATTEDRERRKSKPSFLNPTSLQRLMQRKRRLRFSLEAPEIRRQSDFVTSAVDHESTSFTSQNRRQTLPAVLQPRQEAQAEPREISASPEGSPTLLPDDQDYLTVDDSQLSISEHIGAGLERSHSPPVNRVSREPIFSQRTHTPSRLATIPSTQDILKAVQETPIPSQPVERMNPHIRPAFIDRQDNAERVSPISQAGDLLSASRRREPPPSRKRAREVSEDEETDSDDDFSSYGRAIDISRKREEKAELQRHKRQRIQEEDADESASQLQHGLEQTARGEEAQGPPSTAPLNDSRSPDAASPAGQPSRTSDYGVRTILRPSRYNPRSRWTPAEDARLIRLIEEYGCKWAVIGRQNECQPPLDGEAKFVDRTQVQLKDRARNIKIAYLREGLPLPTHFWNVTMGHKDYAALEKKGIKIPNLRQESLEPSAES
ncbi:telomere repeat binding factor family protein [Aspergillus clavatus NRRL 1]|uniref:Myb-like DNA-binding protein, putative n=1 Tax=Aspergillus clavatus (strain ATCC 1007 / CBS 513.65 / DSM 816 / NCTC 3887 / NRRL 1 / QM 1276 / 107) TaxID=344612 RepID=A1CJH5_ASPCL|nr:Myb-like DNA-binding protein, putative [Aspergillus clavatus NRRL 1]EAW09299.1 Myb-like DNA-binding protein, putative [Aspergillus clavatus NRRL 1]